MSEKQLKKLKKEFTIYDFEKEETFLQEQSASGWHFVSVSNGTYLFEEDQAKREQEYLIDFYTEALDEESVKVYNDNNFELVFTINSSKEGVWYYFAREVRDDNKPKAHNSNGRVYLLDRVKQRIERFGLVLMAVALVFFIYMYIRYQDLVFLIAIVMIGAMSLYLLKLYFNIRDKIKKMK